jgi:hypothetical protein
VDLSKPFSPFPVDCWQFASSCLALTIDPTDEELALVRIRVISSCICHGNGNLCCIHQNQAVYKLLGAMVSDDPTCRPSASEALIVLQNLIHASY